MTQCRPWLIQVWPDAVECGVGVEIAGQWVLALGLVLEPLLALVQGEKQLVGLTPFNESLEASVLTGCFLFYSDMAQW